MTDVLTAALAAHQAGLCPIPAATDGTKRPLGAWKQWQTRRPDPDTLHGWFGNGHRHGLGIVCGAVSGGLEMLELEGQAVTDGLVDAVDNAMHTAGLGDLWGRIVGGYCELTPSGGYHLLWRTPAPDGNLKLARRRATPTELDTAPDEKIKVLIETRGEGGFTIVAPSNGTTHPTGGAWELLTGGFDTIATVTPTERAAVLDVLRQFDRLTGEPASPPPPAPRTVDPLLTQVQAPDGTRPGDEFDDTHNCHDVLEQAGFTVHHTDKTGTHYTRPGKNRNHGASATVWADNNRCTLFSTSIGAPDDYIGDRNLTAWQLHVALNHHGDHSQAAHDWRSTHPRTPAPAAAPAGAGAPPAVTTGTSLTDDFWNARPQLAHIRQAAHSRQRSADAALHVVLARLSAITPHTVTLPPIVGAPAPLAYFTIVVAPPGVGKSSANQIATELLNAPDYCPDQIPLGSGEGLAETLFEIVEDVGPNGNPIKVKRQVLHNGFVYTDEGQTLAEIGGRNGSTLLPTIRTIWTGGVLGQANASIERRRIIPAYNYVFGICIALQPTRAGALLEDVDAGTPQRFGWASATDPTIPDTPPDWPGPLDWQPPARIATGNPLGIDPAIVAEIRTADLQRARGAIPADPLDAHAGLYRLKVAGLLAVLDGRHRISLEDWELAEQIKTTSDRVRDHVAETVAYEAARAEAITRDRLARRHTEAQAAEERRRIVDGARKLAHKVHDEPDRWTIAEIRRALRRWRDVFDDALEHATAEGWIVEQTEAIRGNPNARRWLKPGEQRP